MVTGLLKWLNKTHLFYLYLFSITPLQITISIPEEPVFRRYMCINVHAHIHACLAC